MRNIHVKALAIGMALLAGLMFAVTASASETNPYMGIFLGHSHLIDGYKRQLLGRDGGCLRRRNWHSEGTRQSWSWPDMSSEVSLSNESAYNALRQFLP